MLKFKKLAAIILATTTITTGVISLNGVQAYAETTASAKSELRTCSSNALVYNADNHMKIVANGKFIEDPNNNNKTLFLSTDGSFIKSEYETVGNENTATMWWPSSYKCAIEVEDNDAPNRRAQIISNLPINTVKSSKVNNSMGYSVGGNVTINQKAPSANLSGSFNHSQSISYDQPNFITINTDSSATKAKWDVNFSATDDGYDKDSYNITYGNQMFMKSRSYNTGDKNLTSIDKLPTLISGGFSPDFLVALSAPKDKKESIVKITFEKTMDQYMLTWGDFHWWGSNFSKNPGSTVGKFLVDWQNNTITPINK